MCGPVFLCVFLFLFLFWLATMKLWLIKALCCVASVLLAGLAGCGGAGLGAGAPSPKQIPEQAPVKAPNQAPKPHILMVIVDDFGWADAGYHREGQYKQDVHTPTIDSLVKEGIELDRHYVVRNLDKKIRVGGEGPCGAGGLHTSSPPPHQQPKATFPSFAVLSLTLWSRSLCACVRAFSLCLSLPIQTQHPECTPSRTRFEH